MQRWCILLSILVMVSSPIHRASLGDTHKLSGDQGYHQARDQDFGTFPRFSTLV